MAKSLPIEQLLIWAYRDEIPKQEAGAHSAWNSIDQYSMLGTRISSQNWDVRLPAILGPPHPDALAIAKTAETLPKPSGPLVIHHAIMGTTPDWLPQPITIHAIRDGSRVRIVGKCEGKNRYSPGSYCPLEYRPSRSDLDHARGEYAAWHAGLTTLVQILGKPGTLIDHFACGPVSPPTPWLVDKPKKRVLYALDNLLTGLTAAAKSVAR